MIDTRGPSDPTWWKDLHMMRELFDLAKRNGGMKRDKHHVQRRHRVVRANGGWKGLTNGLVSAQVLDHLPNAPGCGSGKKVKAEGEE
jgi:hypothetical protein